MPPPGYTFRSFQSEADKLLMADLSCRFPAAHLRRSDLPYRFSSWALDDRENARLWFASSGSLVGWAALQSPFWTIDTGWDPSAAADLLPEMLGWAVERAGSLVGTPYERPCWFVNAFADDPEQVGIIEAAGFASQADVGEDSWTKVLLERPGGLALKAYRVPEGYTIRSLNGAEEAGAYVDMHQAVFESKNMTVDWRKRTLRHPDYLPNLDVVVEAPGGGLAAFCIGWLNRRGAVLTGQIEPLGCRAEYRHLGLGRLALAEVLRRLQAHGAQAIQVETDNYRDTAMRLYEAMGFATAREVVVLRRDL